MTEQRDDGKAGGRLRMTEQRDDGKAGGTIEDDRTEG